MHDPSILIFVRDLMFSTRIVEAAKAAGAGYRVIRKAELLANESGAGVLFVDLDQDGAIDAAGAWRARTGGRAIGFVSHVNADAFGRARAVGIDQILSRGQFTQVLPQLVQAGRDPLQIRPAVQYSPHPRGDSTHDHDDR